MIFEEWSEFDEEADVLKKLPADFNEKRESKKWQERKEALDGLFTILDGTARMCTKTNYGEIASNLEQMLKSDTNINIQALVAKCVTGLCKGLRKKFGPYSQSIFAVAIEKLKEKKLSLREPLMDCMDALANTMASLEVVQDEILSGMGQKNPQIKQAVDMFIYRQLTLLTTDKAPKKLLKALGPALGSHFGDADAEVREASFHAAGSIQRLIGERGLKAILGDITVEPAKTTKIEEFAAKAAGVHAENQQKLAPSAPKASTSAGNVATSAEDQPTAAATVAAPAKEIDPFDMMDPVDVLAMLPEEFQTNIQSKKWTDRRDALQGFVDLLVKNPKLDPKANYGDIVATLKHLIEKDANINVQALAAKCLKGVADGLRKKFAPHAASVVPGILEKFKEKKPLLRDPLKEAIDAVVASINVETIQDDIVAAMDKPNPNIKIQTDLFLMRVFKQFDSTTMPKKMLKALTPLLMKHTGDSDPEVRDASMGALGSAMRAIGEKPFLPLLTDIIEDKAKMTKIKEWCQKCQAEIGPEIVQQMVQSVHKADPPAAPTAAKGPPKKALPRSDSQTSLNGDDESLKPGPGGPPAKKAEKPKPKEPDVEPVAEEPPKAQEVLCINDNKQQRLKDERSLKIIKWNFTASPTEEHVQQLAQQLGQEAKVTLTSLLFNKDFKMHIKGVEMLLQMADTTPEALVKNSDLLLKWCTLRFFETNPAVLKQVLDLAKLILQLIRQFEEPMSTDEIGAFVPYLLLKSGEPKENFRVAVKDVMDVVTEITGPLKLTPMLIDALKTKNSRQRAECLTMLENYIARAGVTALKATGIHKAIAACIADRDQSVRNAAINGLVACYREEGDQMWRNAGKLADKERAMVEERIKRSGAAPGSAKPPVMSTPVRGGAKVVVPASAGGTVVRRPASRSRLPVAEDSAPEDNGDDEPTRNMNSTFTQERGRTVDRPNGVRPSTSRYAIDEDFVELTGVHALASTNVLGEVDSFVPRIPPQPVRPTASTPLRRSGSSSSISSLDTFDQIDKVIQNISSGIPQVATEALESIQFMLSQSAEQRTMVEERLSLVIQAVAAQFALIRQVHGTDSPTGRELLKLSLNFLNQFTGGDRKLHVEEEAMCQWMNATIPLISKNSSSDDTVISMNRTLNIITIRVCSRADRTVFVCATLRCLCDELADPQSGCAVLFTKCVSKWLDLMNRDPHPLRPVMLLETLNYVYRKIADRVSAADIRPFEHCMETAINVMGDAIQDAVRRVPNMDHRVISYINVYLRKLTEEDANWMPKLPGVVAEELPRQRSARTESTTPTRREIHILVDNCVRDLGSIHGHVVKLMEHLSKNTGDEQEYNIYTEKCFMGKTVRKFVNTTREGRSVPAVTDQTMVDMAQTGIATKARIARLLERKNTGPSSGPSNVLQNRDINQESFSGDLPVPPNLLNINGPPKEEAKPRKGRRSIDPAVYSALQAKLSEIRD